MERPFQSLHYWEFGSGLFVYIKLEMAFGSVNE